MLFDTRATITAEASLDALWLKTQVISNNLTNVDTPGFKASSVSFEDALRAASDARQTIDGKPTAQAEHTAGKRQSIDGQTINTDGGNGAQQYVANVFTKTEGSVRQDGNNVSLEKEQTELWKTYAQYSYLLDRVAGHYRNITTAVSGMRI